MQISDGERLIAVMIADLMQALKVDTELDPAKIKRLLTSRHEWALAWKYPGIFEGKAPSDAQVDETAEILQMWSWIERSVEELDEPAKSEIKARRWQFSGFDGNNDRHYAIAATIIEELDQFQEFRGRGLNSHSQATLPRYRSMLGLFAELKRAKAGENLTAEELRRLLA